jgi:EmrB/QacA subfamily drug resistance transporter
MMPQTSERATPPTQRRRSSNLVLLLLCIAEFMIVLDFSIVNVALPSIQTDLGFTATDLQWVISAYAVAFGGFLLLGGRVADYFGRRRLFIVGLLVFSAASLVAGFAQDAVMLVILRGLQGLAAAVVAPAALSLLTTSFAEGPARNRALGVYGAVLSFGFVSGVIAGGVLTDLLDWRWVFFVNVPIGIAAAAAAPGLLRESHSAEESGQLDLPGAVTITGSAVSLVYALSAANSAGWASAATLGTLALSIVLLVAFILIEQRTEHPLVPLEIFRLRALVGANLANVLLIGAFVGVTYVVTLFLQRIEGYSPLETGLSFAVLGVAAIIAGMTAAKISARIGIPASLTIGMLLQGIGTLGVAVLPERGMLAYVLAGTALVGFGNVFAVVMISISATAGVPDHQQGLAGGLLGTSQQLGAALGVAAFAAIAAARTSALLPAGVAVDAAGPAELVSGFRLALLLAAAATVLAVFVGVPMLRGRTKS